MTVPTRVLLVEDSPTDAKLVLHELQRGGKTIELERVETPEAMRAALAGTKFDVVISDWSMPKFSALGALLVLREVDADLPFIIVSGTIGEETAVEAMRAGAQDYVLKDKLARLNPALERELREHQARVARRQVESALRESEGRFRRLAESGIIGIVIADVNGNIFEANDAYLALVGYSREELLRGTVRWSDVTPPESLPLAERVIEQLQTSGVAPAFETETLRRDGGRVAVLVAVALLEYPKCIAIVADISERKRAEEGRVHAEEALRQSEEQLRQAQKMEAVGRLAGGVAHDFNNVLSVILSYAEVLLADFKAADPARSDIEQIQGAALRAAGLTRQLLMFSRQQVADPRVVDLNEILLGLDKMLGRILGEDVDLVMLPPKSQGRVKVDPTHIEQLILNLVVNARDAMPKGGQLTLETANVDLDDDYARAHLPAKPGRYVMLAVTDTGAGMDRATQARIFEPFFTTKEKGKGTGLGLSTVFGIVQQSGGNIWVYSEIGRGTTFKVYLPRADGELEAPRHSVEPTTLQGTETILLVEDEEQVRVVVLGALRRQGYHVIAAQNAGEALLLCEKHPGRIDLLLTDVVMPQLSGPELARRLAQTRPEMKVLCMSGYTDDSIVRHGVLESGVAFIQKPVTPTSLSRRIREVLDDASARSKYPSEQPPRK
jgi:two-component system cell cycle sensor histidine kinase/response regulator CckA